jgi:uncharacterized protein (TIGR04255 family)
MPDYPHLTKAPITEAVIDVRVELKPGASIADLDPFAQQVVDAFPDANTLQTRQFEISGADLEMRLPAPTTVLGRIFWNKGKDQAVQARVNGFSFNIVNHYDRWAVHRDQARRLWDRYRATVQPVLVKRCALRYINKIAIPVGEEISNYVRTYPQLPSEVSSNIEEYLMKIVVPLGNDRRCAITQVLPSQTDALTGSLILDLDVYVDRDISPDSEDLWNEFEALHDLKNRCFFESMQPAALEVYK